MSDCLQHLVHFSMNSTHKQQKSSLYQRLSDMVHTLKAERIKHVKYKIILELVDSICKNEQIPVKVQEKLSIILHTSSLDLGNGQNLLGLTDYNYQLNYEEATLLRQLLEKKLIEKFNNIQNQLQLLTGIDPFSGTRNNSTDMALSLEEKVLLDSKKKLNNLQSNYTKNMLTYSNLLEELLHLRTKRVPIVCEAKIKESQLLTKLQDLKAKIQCDTVHVDVFTEVTESLTAYKELFDDIQSQQLECENQVRELTELKERYKQIESKQFSDILKTYLQYKESLEKTQFLYDRLKS